MNWKKKQATEKTNSEKDTNWHHGEFNWLLKEEIRPTFHKHFQKTEERTLLNKASMPVSFIEIDAKILDRTLEIQIQK